MTHDSHNLAGPYALDALDALTDPERRRFERHLSSCAACADEVAGLGKTTARLGLAMSRRAPDALRRRVMAQVARTRQSPPPLARRLPSPTPAGWRGSPPRPASSSPSQAAARPGTSIGPPTTTKP